MSRTEKALCFESILNFGKYKGLNVEDVIDKDPKYIEWALDENILTLKPRVLKYLEDKFEEIEPEWYGLSMWDIC